MNITNRVITLFLLFCLFFINRLYDINIGYLFGLMVLFAGLAFATDTDATIVPIKKNRNITNSLITFGLGIASFFVLTSIISYAIKIVTKLFDLNSIMGLYAQQAPIFEGNAVLGFFSYAIVIALAETLLVVTAIELAGDYLHWASIKDTRTWFLFLMIASGMVILHLTAKYGQADFKNALVMVGVMFFVTSVMIYYTRQYLEAALMHIFFNSATMLVALGYVVSPMMALSYAAIGTVGLLILLNSTQVGKVVYG